MAFLIPARLGEGYTMLGLSRPLTLDALANSFLARQESYGKFLRTYLLEAAVALALLVVLVRALRQKKKDGHVFLLGCLLYGITQTLMESLRLDGHLRFSFVGLQQVLSAPAVWRDAHLSGKNAAETGRVQNAARPDPCPAAPDSGRRHRAGVHD